MKIILYKEKMFGMKKWFIKGVAMALAMSMSVNLSGFTVLAAGVDSEIAVTTEAAFPGVPGEVAKTDKVYSLNTSLTMADEAGTGVTQLQGNKGTADDIKVDASAGKFAPRATDAQVNATTVLYVPIAANTDGAVVTVATSGGTAAVTINGTAYSITTSAPAVVELSASEEAAYCVMEVTGNSYLKEIAVAYKDNEAAFPGVLETAEAKDTAYTLNSSMELLDLNGNIVTQVQSGKGIACGNIKIDATAGKFAPRTGDTQITSGTILYIPVAPDAKGATVTVSGNNYNNLNLTWNGTPISVGTETVFETPETAAYYALEFSGAAGSCYATGITIDYKSDDSYVEKTVTVGQDKQYQTITEALAANTSSAKERLTLMIDPGDYQERVIVESPYVTFKNADTKGEVVIHERYYSSNMRKADGSYDPQDEYDLGTAECGTVIVKSTAAGFKADSITFKNDYNMTYKTEKGTQTPAVALNTRADKVVLTNCKILGRQDTFYPQGAGCRVVLKNCYIEGTVDFIFGDADTYFENCQIHMAAFAGRDSGYFVAPNTKMANTGLVFYNCKLTVDESYTNAEKVSLGRPWQTECESTVNAENQMISLDTTKKKTGYENLGSAAMFIECQMADTMKASRFSSWTRKLYNEENPDGKTVVVSYDQDVRFAEINTRNLKGEFIAAPETLTPYTTVFETGLAADALASRLAKVKQSMAIGEGTTWNPEELTFVPVEVEELEVPVVESANLSNDSAVVTWSAVEGADGYRVFRRSAFGTWGRIATINSGDTLSYTDTALKEDGRFYYTVRAYRGAYEEAEANCYDSAYWSSFTSGKSIVRLTAPSVSTSSKGIVVKWNKTAKASGYRVFRRTADGTWGRIATIPSGKTVSYTDSNAKAGVVYYYTIRAYFGEYETAEANCYKGAYWTGFKSSESASIAAAPAVDTAANGITVTWNKTAGASGYRVFRRTADGTWGRIATVHSADVVSYTDSKAKAGVTYYYTIRAYFGEYETAEANCYEAAYWTGFKSSTAVKR